MSKQCDTPISQQRLKVWFSGSMCFKVQGSKFKSPKLNVQQQLNNQTTDASLNQRTSLTPYTQHTQNHTHPNVPIILSF